LKDSLEKFHKGGRGRKQTEQRTEAEVAREAPKEEVRKLGRGKLDLWR